MMKLFTMFLLLTVLAMSAIDVHASVCQVGGTGRDCGDLTGTFDAVYGQVGIYYFNENFQRNVLLPLYVRESSLSNR